MVYKPNEQMQQLIAAKAKVNISTRLKHKYDKEAVYQQLVIDDYVIMIFKYQWDDVTFWRWKLWNRDIQIKASVFDEVWLSPGRAGVSAKSALNKHIKHGNG